MSQYLPVVALLVLGIVFIAGSLIASKLLAPSRMTAAKQAPYECGIVPSREPPERFPVHFYLVAMLFIMFDIEIIFLYPFAVAFDSLGWFGLVEIFIFMFTVFVAYAYVWRRGGLEWD